MFGGRGQELPSARQVAIEERGDDLPGLAVLGEIRIAEGLRERAVRGAFPDVQVRVGGNFPSTVGA
jgi:hypothetical protein